VAGLDVGVVSSGLAAAAMAWSDEWWDPVVALLWNAEGTPRSYHLVQSSSWYAFGLLQRGGPGDEERAVRTIEALLAAQYDEPGTPWHGTFAQVLESPHPQPGARIWVDYDPNWRQFVGTVFELVLQTDALDDALRARMRTAVDLAVAGEPLDRVPPTYSNIALMRAWLEVERGRDGALAYARSVVDAFAERGAFEEYNSPTYYGIDLYALALWRTRSSSPELRAWGAEVEAALWRDIARWYHPGLRNLCGPWSRSYGMDLTRYVGLVGLWMWDALGSPSEAPVPDVTGGRPFDHPHDLTLGVLVEHLGAAIPAEVTFDAVERTVAQDITATRRATGWLAEDVMVGGESGDSPASARGQFTPATVHWRLPSGDVGWIRLTHFAPASAVASPRSLAITCFPHARRGPQAPELWVHAPGASIAAGARRWALPGLSLDVASAPESVEADPSGFLRIRFPVGTGDLSLRLT